ncbi:MAG: heme exporter protein CcmB [Acidobacteriota bacterium]|jgi:heme exporter protein B
MRGFFRIAFLVFRKDFREELRRKENIAVSVFFAVLSLVLFYFSLDPTQIDLTTAGAGFLWLIILFAGSLFMGACFRKETETGTLHALLLAPADRGAVYLGKYLVNLLFLLFLEGLLLFVAFILLDFRAGKGLWPLCGVWFLVSVGYAGVGTLLSALITQVRGGEILYPILLFPILIPLVIAAGTLTQAALAGSNVWQSQWLRLVGLFDIIFITASLFLFEYAVEE